MRQYHAYKPGFYALKLQVRTSAGCTPHDFFARSRLDIYGERIRCIRERPARLQNRYMFRACTVTRSSLPRCLVLEIEEGYSKRASLALFISTFSCPTLSFPVARLACGSFSLCSVISFLQPCPLRLLRTKKLQLDFQASCHQVSEKFFECFRRS